MSSSSKKVLFGLVLVGLLFSTGSAQFLFCDRCLEIWTQIDTALNSTEAIEIMMQLTHDDFCLGYWGQWELDDECLVWYFDNYDILIQMFEVGLDALAWDVLEPHAICQLLQLCPPEMMSAEASRAKSLDALQDFVMMFNEARQN